MTLLRRVLTAGAVLLLLWSVALIVAPVTVAEGLLGREALRDEVWVRLLAAAGISLALFHVLILRKLDDLWWWCWAFVIFDGLAALILLVHAAVGVPDGSAAGPWWAYGAASSLFAALYLAGLAKAGQEKPFV